MDLHASRRGMRAAAAPWSAALSGGLLELYDSARACTLDEFELRAARRLGGLVGFDGAVWGRGAAGGTQAPITITHAAVVDRPAQLLPDYGPIAALDPVTARFLRAPCEPLAIDVEATYRTRRCSPVREYLHEYRIGQLLLLGVGDAGGASMAWITAYREAHDAPFTAQEVDLFRALLPHWLQARELCAAWNLERHACGCSADAGHAMCDRQGLLHASDARFAALTGRASGGRLDAAVLRVLLAGAACAVGTTRITASGDGTWLILTAHSQAAHARLPGRLAEVAQRYADGASYKQIARDLDRSPATIRTQLQTIFARLSVHTRTELMRALHLQ